MITKFDGSYAGHIDIEHVGYGGTAVNDRRFSNAQLATVFDKGRDIAKLLERVGYDTFWAAEHHFQPEGYECIPNLLMWAVHLAHVTQAPEVRLWLQYHPDVASAAAGRGFCHWPTSSPAGGSSSAWDVAITRARSRPSASPMRDQNANRELFEEQVEIIFKAFNSPSFSHQGKYYTLPPRVPYRGYELKELTLVPQPDPSPVECWQPIQSATPRGLDFMAKHGIKGAIGGGVAEGGAMHNVMEGYREALRRVGRDVQLGEDLAIGFHFRLAKTQEEGIKAAAKHYEENLKMFGPLRLVRGLSDAQIEAMADPRRAPSAGLPTLEEAVNKGAFLCGPPELIIEQLMRLEERYPGLERITVSHPVSTPHAVMLEQWEWFAAEVMPAFKKRVQEPVSAN